MEVRCHDLTPFTNFVCLCGFVLHTHKSQIEHMPDGAQPAVVCRSCSLRLLLPPQADVLELIRLTYAEADLTPFPLLPLLD